MILALGLLGMRLIGAALWWLQPRMLFFPLRPLSATPAAWGLTYEDVHLVTDDGVTLHGWLILAPTKHSKPPRKLLFFHDNAGDLSHRRDSIAIFTDLGLDVLIIDTQSGFG